MKKFTLNLKKCVFFLASLSFLLFSGFELPEEETAFIQNFLTKYYDKDGQNKDTKRFEINVTNTGFCRYRRILNNGKEEYFAFNLSRFKSMDFYGSTAKGELYLRTKNDDVVVQTRNDRKGEVDSTGTFLMIPLKDVDETRLNELAQHFKQANEELAKM
ncbi:MAG: hypothetical protein REI78_13545 [Pedobacter sp.]|nr:hypothetical protein [Pedobacter sp.]